jgi:ATP-dependent helicase/nuclease subunit B
LIRLPNDLSDLIRDGGTVVVPSRQRAHAARLGHAAAQLSGGVRVWTTPDILTAEAWLLREFERCATVSAVNLPRVLSPAEDWLLWRQCTEEAAQDLELLNRGALAEALRRASALAAEFGIDLSQRHAFAGAEMELLWQVEGAVNQRCRKLHAATVQSLVAKLSNDRHAQPPTCAGFLKLPPRLRAAGLAQRGAGPAIARPKAVVAVDELDELELIAQWCKQQIAARPDARLLVILCTSPGARERLATLIRQAVDPQGWLEDPGTHVRVEHLVIIEGGASLADMPVVSHALSTLRWLGGLSGEFGDASEWLRAPYWQVPGAADRARIDLWLRERGDLNIKGREWIPILSAAPAPISAAARELAAQIKAATQALGEGLFSPREWSERFRAALDEMNWPGDRVRDSSEQQTVVRLHELLDEFGQLASSVGAMSRDDAIHWFGELASRTAFRPADADAVVTISAALADPVVLYDGIWVAGLHAEAFPQPVQPDPFLPLAAQLSAGIPAASAAGRLAEARALVAAWRAATEELVLSAPARSDDLELLPSPMLREWSVKDEVAGAPPRTLSWLPQLIHRTKMIECIDDSKGSSWPIDRTLPAGTRSLELQNLCGFRAYAEMRLGSAELGLPEPGVAPDVRGQLVHAALQTLWQQLRDSQTLAAYGEGSLDALIEQSVAKAGETVLGLETGGEHPPLFAREIRRARRLIKVLCALELQRSPFTVQSTEFETQLTLAGARMSVRIDRLDSLHSGGRAILDYKTGARIAADWYGERPSHPQLLAYLAAIGGDAVAMATVNVTAREVRFDGIANSPQLLPKVKGVEGPGAEDVGDAWQFRRREWLARIEKLASDFLEGRAAVDPKPGACDYCQVVSICRIADRGLDVMAEVLEATFEDDYE